MNATDSWIRRFFPCAEAPVQLLCLPHAGGSAPFYRPMAQVMSPVVEVLAVQYPGRQDRRLEPMVEDLHTLADQITEAALPALDRPFAIFGHSMGAVLAYEVALRLEAAGTAPREIYVSGRRAPSTVRDEQVHLRDDDGVIAELLSLSGTDQRVFGDEELLRMVLPAIRNDYRAIETYPYRPGRRLNCPISALIGDADPKAGIAEVEAWGAHTADDFRMHTYRGGHFYLIEHAAEVIRLLTQELGALTAPTAN